MTLSIDEQRLIRNFSLGFVATVTASGQPAVSPKGTFLILDENTIAFGHIRSPKTLKNLQDNPAIEVNFADPFTRKAVRVRGRASIIQTGQEFETLIPSWQEMWGELADRIKAIVKIELEHSEMILTPPYDDGVNEEEMIEIYKKKYEEIYP